MAVPSLVRSWVLECKDRQLSSSVISYTSLYFSPVIIRTELELVKSPEATRELVDENLVIKVANSVNEVSASYLVDEHPLEITLKMPSDWPLHRIEIKDVKPVGVDEKRWRAWILAVHQIIWSHVSSKRGSRSSCLIICLHTERPYSGWTGLLQEKRGPSLRGSS